jgi:hypothetical protein
VSHGQSDRDLCEWFRRVTIFVGWCFELVLESGHRRVPMNPRILTLP